MSGMCISHIARHTIREGRETLNMTTFFSGGNIVASGVHYFFIYIERLKTSATNHFSSPGIMYCIYGHAIHPYSIPPFIYLSATCTGMFLLYYASTHRHTAHSIETLTNSNWQPKLIQFGIDDEINRSTKSAINGLDIVVLVTMEMCGNPQTTCDIRWICWPCSSLRLWRIFRIMIGNERALICAPHATCAAEFRTLIFIDMIQTIKN